MPTTDVESINNFDDQTWEIVFQKSPVGVALMSKDGHWLKVNEKVQQILGYSESELIGMTYMDVTHPSDVKPDTDMMNKLALGKIKNYEMIKRFITKNQYVVPVRMNMSAIHKDDSDEILYFIKHIQPLLNGEKLKYDTQTRADGGSTLEIRTTPTLLEILRDNWKQAITAAVFLLATSIGFIVSFELLKFRVNAMEKSLQKIERMLETLDERDKN